MEEWRDVFGYEGIYQVSDAGSVRRTETGRVLRKSGKKYDKVTLSKDGVREYKNVHRLVWEAFRGPVPDGMVINHMDEDKRNNFLSNLMICTQRENVNWGTGVERRAKKWKEGRPVLTPEEKKEEKRKRKRDSYLRNINYYIEYRKKKKAKQL